MAAIKIIIAFATLVAMAYASEIGLFYFAYSLAPYAVSQDLERAWKACPENTTEESRYQAVLKEARACFNDLTKSNKSLCHSLEERVQRCSQPLVDFFVDCLPEKSKDLPPAISKGAASLVEAFCTSSGDLLLEALNPCLYEYLDQSNKTIREECKKETLQPKLSKFEDEVPSKVEACAVILEVGNCWQEYVNEVCPSSASKELFSKFYNVATVSCK